jgi:hypothetical protein
MTDDPLTVSHADDDHLQGTRQLVALTPADIPRQQQALIVWLDRKLHTLGRDRSDAIDNARIAVEHGWKADNFERACRKLEAQITYYTKLRAAVDAGYLIVPNFDVEVIAVRTHRENPWPATSEWEGSQTVRNAVAEALPVGEGRYVGGQNATTIERWVEPDPSRPGKELQKKRESAEDFTPVEFPVQAIRPEVVDATARAMTLKIFDRIGVVTGRREDPIVVGQVLKPGLTKYQRSVGRADRVTFFVAWWLDPESL